MYYNRKYKKPNINLLNGGMRMKRDECRNRDPIEEILPMEGAGDSPARRKGQGMGDDPQKGSRAGRMGRKLARGAFLLH